MPTYQHAMTSERRTTQDLDETLWYEEAAQWCRLPLPEPAPTVVNSATATTRQAPQTAKATAKPKTKKA